MKQEEKKMVFCSERPEVGKEMKNNEKK